LILRRTAKYGGFWQGVTGAVEDSEGPLEGARRELKEEAQLMPARLFKVEFDYTFPLEEEWKWAYAPDVETVKEFVFLAEISVGSEPKLSFEHDQYAWMPYAPAMARLKWPNNRRALEFCNSLLTS
jgi:dATP pyrophosphohydrolase